MFLSHIRLFEKAIDQTHDHIALFDANANYIYANEAYTQRTKYSLGQLLGRNPKILKSGKHNNKFYENMYKTLGQGQSLSTVFCNKDAHGIEYFEKQTLTPIFDKKTLVGYVAFGKSYDHDIKKNEQLAKETKTDSLTSLFNKKMLYEKLDEAIERFRIEDENFCMFFIDLDDFKILNDTKGHHIGDEALYETGKFLKSCVRRYDDLFRFGGDEFVILIYSCTLIDAHKVFEHIKYKYQTSKLKEKYGVGLSIGYAQYANQSPTDFLYLADKKMYEAKAQNKSLS